MKDMFDYFEEDYDDRSVYLIIRIIKNKKSRSSKILYFCGINGQDSIVWSRERKFAYTLYPYFPDYKKVKDVIRKNNVRCSISKFGPYSYSSFITEEEEDEKIGFFEKIGYWIRSKWVEYFI